MGDEQRAEGREGGSGHGQRQPEGDAEHEAALLCHGIEAKGDKEVAELIRRLLEEKGEVEGNAQGGDGQDAVPGAADGGIKNWPTQREHDAREHHGAEKGSKPLIAGNGLGVRYGVRLRLCAGAKGLLRGA